MRLLLLSLVGTLLLLTPNITKAQNLEYPSTINVNAGFSLIGTAVNLLDIGMKNQENSFFNTYTYPAIQFNYDYALDKHFSIGGGLSFQQMGISIRNIDIEYLSDFILIEQLEAKFSRLNLGLRGLVHYGNFERLDIYSGIRAGIDICRINAKIVTQGEFILEEFITERLGFLSIEQTANFSFQVIAFGIRTYFTDNIGINAEIAMGAPHYLSIGLTGRF